MPLVHSLHVTKEEFLSLASCFANIPGTHLYFSGGSGDSAERSFLWAFPIKTVTADLNACKKNPEDVWKKLSDEIGSIQQQYPITLSGFLGYEMGFCSHKQLYHLI